MNTTTCTITKGYDGWMVVVGKGDKDDTLQLKMRNVSKTTKQEYSVESVKGTFAKISDAKKAIITAYDNGEI